MIRPLAALAIAAMLSGITGCEQSEPIKPSGGRKVVVCTTTMIADMARRIGGDRAEVIGIMKAGEDPHIYDVRPRDAQLIGRADVVLANGLHLESTLEQIIKNNTQNAVVANLAEAKEIKKIFEANGETAPDPHCWMNVKYFKAYARDAAAAISKADPPNADFYASNADAYMKELDELDAWVSQQMATIPEANRTIATSHDAFNYLAAAYGIKVHGVIGLSTEQQPKPRDVEALEAMVKENKIRALFVETSTPNLNRLVRKIAENTGTKIGGTLYSDSLGEPSTEAGTYIGMMRHNITTIVEALR